MHTHKIMIGSGSRVACGLAVRRLGGFYRQFGLRIFLMMLFVGPWTGLPLESAAPHRPGDVAPPLTAGITPYDWTVPLCFPAIQPAYPGVIGARSTYSSGNASVDEWVGAARLAGLSYLVFLEDFSLLSPEKLAALQRDCDRLSNPDFAVLPGFVIDDEMGYHYFYFSRQLHWPDKRLLSDSGRKWTGYDPDWPYRGQLAMTTFQYTHDAHAYNLTAGHYKFKASGVPFANFFCNGDAVAVVTRAQGEGVENITSEYLALTDGGQMPQPIVVELMDSPELLAKTSWRTVLRLPLRGGDLASGPIDDATKIRDYWSRWQFLKDNPCSLYITEGPELDTWCYAGHLNYEGANPGDYVWQNYRWVLRGRVRSTEGLKEVAVYDGANVFRRFLLDGTNRFEFTLNLTHNQQHNLVLVATDLKGRQAISSEQFDRNHRLEECQSKDRNVQLSFGYQVTRDGHGLKLGGGVGAATPNKRVDDRFLFPAQIFADDFLLGASRSHGAALECPSFFMTPTALEGSILRTAPNVSESVRLLHSADVQIGESVWNRNFTDHIKVGNVWRTLWATTNALDFEGVRRCYFFQVDPDSPLAVYRWQLELTLLRDMTNSGFSMAHLYPMKSRLWALRGSDEQAYAGIWAEGLSPARKLDVSFGPGAYAAFLASPQGGEGVFPLVETGLRAVMLRPEKSAGIEILLPAGGAPQNKGEHAILDFLLVGIPRMTAESKMISEPSNEIMERFRNDFGLANGKPTYYAALDTGRIKSQRYVMDISGVKDHCASGKWVGRLVSALPITVSGLNENWSAFLLDRHLKQARPLGMFEGKAWATVVLNGEKNLFIGHPLVCDQAQLVLQVTQVGDTRWKIEVHNPMDRPLTTTLTLNPFFDPWNKKTISEEPLVLPAGRSVILNL